MPDLDALGCDRDELRSAWAIVADVASDFGSTIRQHPVTGRASPDAWVEGWMARLATSGRVPLDELCEALIDASFATGVQVTHPRHLGLFIAPVWPQAVIADAIASLFNFQLSTPKLAPLAYAIEDWTLAALGARVGGQWRDAHFTNGGSEANLTALLAALSAKFPDRAARGLSASARPKLYVTGETHESMIKAAKIVGIGTDAVTVLARACPTELRERVLADVASGATPFMIVGTFGTPATGAIEPIAGFADVAAEADCWFHVDAAWGAGAALSPKRSAMVADLGRADSLAWDAHKWMCASLVCGMIFCRRPGALAEALDVVATYMPPSRGETELFRTSVPWSRRSLGLKVFATIASVGWAGLANHIERTFDTADALRRMLRGDGWTIVNDTPLPVVCFNRPGLDAAPSVDALVDAMQAEGLVWLTAIPVASGRRALRACIKNSNTSGDDLAVLIDALHRHRRG